jgi:hypothetical protein
VGELIDCLQEQRGVFILFDGNLSSIGNESIPNTGASSTGAGVPSTVVHTGVSTLGVGSLAWVAVGSAVVMFL